jgi:CelD/BcsL family acetyltransferase involved in cellulose biosynthesis
VCAVTTPPSWLGCLGLAVLALSRERDLEKRLLARLPDDVLLAALAPKPWWLGVRAPRLTTKAKPFAINNKVRSPTFLRSMNSLPHLRVETVQPGDLTRLECAAWLAFLVETPEFATPFLHPDYTQLVGRLRPDTAVSVIRKGTKIVGFFPHQRRPLRFARAVGAPFSDGHGIVATDGAGLNGPEVLGLAGLGAFRFTNLIDPEGCFRTARCEMTETFMTWISDQPGETLRNLRQTHTNHAKKMRRVYRQVDDEQGGWRLEIDCRNEAIFRRLIALKSEQFVRTGLHDVLASPFARAMLDQLWKSPMPGLRGQLSVLWFSDQPVAMEYNLVSGDYMSGWLIAYEPDYQRYSPGLILAEELIGTLPNIGIRIYDKGISYGRYKKYTSNVCGRRADGIAFGTDAPARLRQWSSRAYGDLERLGGDRLGSLAGRVRRRFDHIMEAELGWTRRIAGIGAGIGKVLTNSRSG